MKKPSRRSNDLRVECVPSHVLFADTLAYCVQGRTNRALKSTIAGDHVAELCMLLHHDIDGDLWVKTAANAEGRKIRKALDGLVDRVARDSDERAARLLYSVATEATYEVMNIYLRHRELFDRIAPRRKLLPCLESIHPRTADVSSQMRRDARLGEQTDDKFRIGSKGWFVSDAPANIYARAIITHVELNQLLQAGRSPTGILEIIRPTAPSQDPRIAISKLHRGN